MNLQQDRNFQTENYMATLFLPSFYNNISRSFINSGLMNSLCGQRQLLLYFFMCFACPTSIYFYTWFFLSTYQRNVCLSQSTCVFTHAFFYQREKTTIIHPFLSTKCLSLSTCVCCMLFPGIIVLWFPFCPIDEGTQRGHRHSYKNRQGLLIIVSVNSEIICKYCENKVFIFLNQLESSVI